MVLLLLLPQLLVGVFLWWLLLQLLFLQLQLQLLLLLSSVLFGCLLQQIKTPLCWRVMLCVW